MRHILSRTLFATVPLWIAAPASAQWTGTGPVWTNDQVGINTATPNAPLDVFSGTAPETVSVMNVAAQGFGLHAIAAGPDGTALFGNAWPGEGDTVGVAGQVWSPDGKAIYGYSGALTGTPIAIHGEQQGSNGYSGYFEGGSFHVDPGSSGFIGLGRDWRINTTEAVGIHQPTSSWGGMYMDTNAGGRPYYGYSTGGSPQAYHYFDSLSSQWRLYCGGTRLAVSKSSGRVGIATTSPGYTLHVNGSAGKPGGGSWSNASDLRLKEDVEPIGGALDRLLSVRGVTYRYKNPEAIHEREGTQLGVIAQEVEEAFPDWVDEGDDGYKRVTFRGFEGVTIEALRELREENERLRRELDETNATLTDLAARLEVMEAGSR